jgi:hypothetical protein
VLAEHQVTELVVKQALAEVQGKTKGRHHLLLSVGYTVAVAVAEGRLHQDFITGGVEIQRFVLSGLEHLVSSHQLAQVIYKFFNKEAIYGSIIYQGSRRSTS